jgi:hypothetical protein
MTTQTPYATFSIQKYATTEATVDWANVQIATELSCGLLYFLYGSDAYIGAFGYNSNNTTSMSFKTIFATNNNNTLTVSGSNGYVSFAISGSTGVDMYLTVKMIQYTSTAYASPQIYNFKNGYNVCYLQAAYSGAEVYIPTNYNTSGWIIGISTDNSGMYFMGNFNNTNTSSATSNISNYNNILAVGCTVSAYYNNYTVTQSNGVSAYWAYCFVSSGVP